MSGGSISNESSAVRRALRSAFKGGFKAPLREDSDGRLTLKRAERTRKPPAKLPTVEDNRDRKINALIDFCAQLQKSLQDAGMLEE